MNFTGKPRSPEGQQVTEHAANSWRSWLALSLLVVLNVVLWMPKGSPPYLKEIALQTHLRVWVQNRIILHRIEGTEFLVEGVNLGESGSSFSVLVRFDEELPQETPAMSAIMHHDNLTDYCVTLIFPSGKRMTLDTKTLHFRQSTAPSEQCGPEKAYLYLLRQ